jgi:hypothetical protein
MSTIFWTTKPGLLISPQHITEIYPTASMSDVNKLNAVSRLTILLTILGYLTTNSIRVLFAGVITLIIIVIVHTYYKKTGNIPFITNNTKQNKPKEGFELKSDKKLKTAHELKTYLESSYTQSTPTNPLSNVLLTDIQNNPDKKSAPPAFQPNVYADINNNTKKMVSEINKDFPGIEEKLFGSLGENFDFDMSMRQFNSTANTRIANDQGAFAQYCYGNMPSCKDGDVLQCSSNNERPTMY